MIKNELKPCPFCGCAGAIEHGECSNGIGELIHTFYDVICTNPDCVAHPDCPKTYKSKEEAVNNWNIRSSC